MPENTRMPSPPAPLPRRARGSFVRRPKSRIESRRAGISSVSVRGSVRLSCGSRLSWFSLLAPSDGPAAEKTNNQNAYSYSAPTRLLLRFYSACTPFLLAFYPSSTPKNPKKTGESLMFVKRIDLFSRKAKEEPAPPAYNPRRPRVGRGSDWPAKTHLAAPLSFLSRRRPARRAGRRRERKKSWIVGWRFSLPIIAPPGQARWWRL